MKETSRLTYYRVDKGNGQRKRITHEQALVKVLGTYRDNDMTRDMLKVVNRIELPYCYIEVVGEWIIAGEARPRVLMAGLSNMLPDGAEYDEDGNRI